MRRTNPNVFVLYREDPHLISVSKRGIAPVPRTYLFAFVDMRFDLLGELVKVRQGHGADGGSYQGSAGEQARVQISGTELRAGQLPASPCAEAGTSLFLNG